MDSEHIQLPQDTREWLEGLERGPWLYFSYYPGVFTDLTQRMNAMDEQIEHDQDITASQLVSEVQTVEEHVPEEQVDPVSGVGASMHFEDECESTPESASEPIPSPQEHKVNLLDIFDATDPEGWAYICSFIEASYPGESDLRWADRDQYLKVAVEAMNYSSAQADTKKTPEKKNKFKQLIECGKARDPNKSEPTEGYALENMGYLDPWVPPSLGIINKDIYIFRLAFLSAVSAITNNSNILFPRETSRTVVGRFNGASIFSGNFPPHSHAFSPTESIYSSFCTYV